jgi:hypothetical protein
VEGQLQALLNCGLGSIGKTKAKADVVFSDIRPKFPSDSKSLNPEGKWIITLQTAAILCNPAELDEKSGRNELRNAYEKCWEDISSGKLKLTRYFASQSLSGGYYLIRRFQPNKPYNPFLLTNPGSVFVLEAKSAVSDAQELIDVWISKGLPIPDWAKSSYGETWKSCPYLPNDGFGEITVNLTCHVSKCPTKEMLHAIP